MTFIDILLQFCYNYYGDSNMVKKKIDLSDIKEKSLEETTSFADLMTRHERKKRSKEDLLDDIEDMIKEKRRSTEDLTEDLKDINEREIEEKDIKKKKKEKKTR